MGKFGFFEMQKNCCLLWTAIMWSWQLGCVMEISESIHSDTPMSGRAAVNLPDNYMLCNFMESSHLLCLVHMSSVIQNFPGFLFVSGWVFGSCCWFWWDFKENQESLWLGSEYDAMSFRAWFRWLSTLVASVPESVSESVITLMTCPLPCTNVHEKNQS